MITTGQTFENPVTGERMVFNKTAQDTNGTLLEVEFFIKPHSGRGLPAHIHMYFDEWFEIIAGSSCYTLGKTELTAKAGDVVVLPKRITHVHPWNMGNDELHLRQVIQLDQANMQVLSRVEAFFETTYALAQQGKMGKNGTLKDPLQAVVVAQAIEPTTYIAGLPIWIQRPLFGVLASIGRALGYKAFYPAVSTSATAL